MISITRVEPNPPPPGYAYCVHCLGWNKVYDLLITGGKLHGIITHVYLCLDCLRKLYTLLGENKEVNP